MKDRRIAILFLTIFIDLLGFGIVIPILPNLAKELSMESGTSINPDVAVGLIAAVFSIIQFIFAPLFGSLSDRIGRRPIILGSILVNAFGYVLFGLSQSFWVLILARIISGFGSANISAAQAYIADITSYEDRAKKMGIIGAAFGLGFVFGPPLGGWLYGSETLFGVDVKQLFHIHESANHSLFIVGLFTALLCLLNFVLAWKFLPESNTQKSTVKRSPTETFTGMLEARKIPIISELMLINFIYIAAFSMMQINASVLWKEKYDLNPVAIGNIFGVIGIFSAVVQGGLIGVFQKKLGLRKMLIWGAPIAGIGLSLIPLPSKEWFYAVQFFAIFCLALANGLLMPAINSLVSLNAPANAQGQMLGIMQSLGSLARAVGPLLSGLLYAQFYMLPYLAGGILMMVNFGLALILAKQLNQTPQQVVKD